MPFYAVKSGKIPGIYANWNECEKQVKGFKGAKFKKFNTQQEAAEFVNPGGGTGGLKIPPKISANSPKSLKRKKSSETIESHYLCSRTAEKNFYFDKRHANNKQELVGACTVASSNGIEPKLKKIKLDPDCTKELMKVEKLKVNKGGGKDIDTVIDSFEIILARGLLIEYKINDMIDYSFESKSVSVYTDGACSGNGKSNPSGGIGIFWGPDHPLNIGRPLLGVQTNNRAEITAAIIAICQAIVFKAEEVTIYTDSMFMINCQEKWIANWKKNDWKTSSKQPVKNIPDLKRLDLLCVRMKTKWIYVPGHKGVYGNEEADKLATGAVCR